MGNKTIAMLSSSSWLRNRIWFRREQWCAFPLWSQACIRFFKPRSFQDCLTYCCFVQAKLLSSCHATYDTVLLRWDVIFYTSLKLLSGETAMLFITMAVYTGLKAQFVLLPFTLGKKQNFRSSFFTVWFQQIFTQRLKACNVHGIWVISAGASIYTPAAPAAVPRCMTRSPPAESLFCNVDASSRCSIFGLGETVDKSKS